MYSIEVEKREAIQAGNQALKSLNQAYSELNKAKNWGLIDIFGGGTITTLIKHSKMNNAQNYINQAKYDLKVFRKEVSDLDGYLNLDMDVSSFLCFADFFFDGFVADWLVQGQINQARGQIQDAINRVRNVMDQINRY